MYRVTHRIAEITFQIESNNAKVWFPGVQQGGFAQFRVSNAIPDVCLQIQSVDRTSWTLAPLSQKEIKRLATCGIQGANSALFRSPLVRAVLPASSSPEQISLILDPWTATIVNFTRRTLHLFYSHGMTSYYEKDKVRPLLVAFFLPAFDAAMIHCSSMIWRGRGAIFLARDGGGKTTLLRQATKEMTFLSDDQNIIRRIDGQIHVFGTPWGGISTNSAHAPLGGIFLLEKAERFEVVPVSPAQILYHLWDEHLNYRFNLPREDSTKLFNLFSDACFQIPTYLIRFPQDHVDWSLIDQVMR
jgi:hypothetical protein